MGEVEAMNDDECTEWLSGIEALLLSGDYVTGPYLPDVQSAMRTLAETRKALAASMHRHDVHDEGPTDHCPICGHVHRNHSIIPVSAHEPTCVFATMPRPR
jgi:hypothetical protein